MSQDGDELALAIEYSHVLADDDDADDAMLQAMWASLRERRASRGPDGKRRTALRKAFTEISNVHVLFRPLVLAQMAVEVQSALMSVERTQKH